MKKYIIGLITGLAFVGTTAYGLSITLPFQGGTGTSSIPTTDSILIGNVNGRYDVKTLTAGTNVTIDNSGSTVTISSSGTGGGSGVGNVSTSSVPSVGYLSYWTTTTATPALLGKVATSSLTATTPLVASNASAIIGPDAVAISCTTAESGVGGCLSSTAFDTFNNKAGLSSNTFTGLQTFPYSSSTIYSSFITASTSQFYATGLSGCDPSSGKLIWSNGTFACGADAGAGASGEANTASSLGTGLNIYDSKLALDLRFNTLSAGTNMTISTSSNNNTLVFNGLAYPFPSAATSTKLTFSGGLSTTYASTTGISGTYASSTNLFAGIFNIPSLATAAGTFVAIDPTGRLIATTTPSGSATPGGSDTQVQFNDGGVFGGDSRFIFDKTLDNLTYSGGVGSELVMVVNGGDTGFGMSSNNVTLNAPGILQVGGGTGLEIFDLTSTYSAIASTTLLSADHTFQFPDKDGTFAMLDDITGGFSYPFPAGATTTPVSFTYASTTHMGVSKLYGNGSSVVIDLTGDDTVDFNALDLITTASITGGSLKSSLLTLDSFSLLDTDGFRNFTMNYGLGVGTTTTLRSELTVASTTAPQLSLSAGAGLPQWIMRNAGGNLYFATTTVAGTATTSTSMLSLLSTGIANLLGAWDFGGADSLEIPNGTAPTTDAIGEIAYDTSDKQLLVATTTANTPIVIPTMQRLWSATIASTSVDFVSGGRIWMPPQRDGFDVVEIHCAVDGGTSVVINVSNSGGTTDSETVTCDADGAVDTSIDTNSVYAAGSLNSLEVGTITGSVDYVTFSIYGYITRE